MFGSSWRGSSTKIHVFQCVEYRFTDKYIYMYSKTSLLYITVHVVGDFWRFITDLL